MNKPAISFETERLYVRPIEHRDKEYYMALRKEASEISAAYVTFPEFVDYEWENELASTDDIYLAVFLKTSDVFVASASFQAFQSETVELGFDICPDYRNKGIATELVREMLHISKSAFPDKPVRIRTSVHNSACRRVAEKCGGVLSGYEPTTAAKTIDALIHSYEEQCPGDDILSQIKQQNAEFIEENKLGICEYRFE